MLGLVVFVAAIAIGFKALLVVVNVVNGDEHWILSARDEPGGLRISIGTAEAKIPAFVTDPTFVVFVKGYRLGQDAGPIVLDAEEPKLPSGWSIVFQDTTVLPGACRIRAGPVFLDFHEASLTANGSTIGPGEWIEVNTAAVPVPTRPAPTPQEPAARPFP